MIISHWLFGKQDLELNPIWMPTRLLQIELFKYLVVKLEEKVYIQMIMLIEVNLAMIASLLLFMLLLYLKLKEYYFLDWELFMQN